MPVFSSISDQEKTELWACLALRHSPSIGALTAKKLIDFYGSAFEAVEVGRKSPGNWLDNELISIRKAKAFSREEWRASAIEEWQLLQKLPLNFIYLTHPQYPEHLKEIPDPPIILYYKGELSLINNPMVAIVGSRKCTEEGIRVAAFFAKALSDAGISIVSGMAMGIDRAAHISGLAGVGSSVAVVGTGIDKVYPASNRDLYNILAEEGLLLSEFLPATPPSAKNFPVRNRIISALSKGVLIVEASKRSGSLITARLALEQNRDVFVVPGQALSKNSEGCQELIRNGAKAVFNADDIIIELLPLLSEDLKERIKKSSIAKEDSDFKLEPFSIHESISRENKVDLPALIQSVSKSSNKKTVDISKEKSEEKVQNSLDTDSKASDPEGQYKKREWPEGLSENELALLRFLEKKSAHIDEISRELKVSPSQLSLLLTFLEIKGLIRQEPGMIYKIP